MTCEDVITIAELQLAKLNAGTSDEFVSSLNDTTPNQGHPTEPVIRTITGINSAADSAIGSIGGVDNGFYINDPLMTEYNQYVKFDRAGTIETYKVKSTVPLDYQINSGATPDPLNDANLQPFSDVTKRYVDNNTTPTKTLADAKVFLDAEEGMYVFLSDLDSGKYRYVTGEIANNANIYDHDTLPLQLSLVITNPVNANWFGMSVSNLDNSPQHQIMIDNPDVTSADFGEDGDYIFLSKTTNTRDIKITQSPGSFMNCLDPAFSGDAWMDCNGELTQIENLGANATKDDRVINFANAPSLEKGDVFVIYNPTDFSWSGFRAAYHAGEYCKVVDIVGNDVTVDDYLWDSYDIADVAIYRLDSIKVDIQVNLKGDVSTNLLRLSRCADSVVTNLHATHSNNSCISINRCFNVDVNEPKIHNEGDGGDDYGIAVANSQRIRVNNPAIYARRHPVTMGGGNDIGSVPCRDVKVRGGTLVNGDSSIHCADWHGNAEGCQYIEVNIQGGATHQGKDNGYIDCVISPTGAGVIATGAEIKGGRHYLQGCELKAVGNPADIGRGFIDFGGNTTVISADTTENCLFQATNCSVQGGGFGSNTSFMLFDNRGSTKKMNVLIDDIRLAVDDLSAILRTELTSGTADSSYIIVNNITSALTGKSLCAHIGNAYIGFPHRLQVQAGSQTVTTNTGNNTAVGILQTFQWSYPRIPVPSTDRYNRGAIGGEYGFASANPLTTTDITPILRNEKGSNWAAAVTVELGWSVFIKEV